MKSDQCITDSGHGVTVLYYYNVKKGYKFIGDDPEGQVIPIPKDIRDRVYKNNNVSGLDSDMPAEAYLDKFYLHNRCLLFPSGVWMSETAGVPHALINKPGTYLNFKMAGMTRLTALTDNASAICIGPDPDKDIGYYNRTVHKIDEDIIFDRTDRLLVATQDMWYDGDIVKAGQPYHVQRTGKLKLLHSGYVVEFWLDDINIEESLNDYVNMWVNHKILLKERRAKD